MARQRANDLAELSVDIELFPMPKSDGHNIAAADDIEESKEPAGAVGHKVN